VEEAGLAHPQDLVPNALGPILVGGPALLAVDGPAPEAAKGRHHAQGVHALNPSQEHLHPRTVQKKVQGMTSKTRTEGSTASARIEENTVSARIEENTVSARIEENTVSARIEENTVSARKEGKTVSARRSEAEKKTRRIPRETQTKKMMCRRRSMRIRSLLQRVMLLNQKMKL